MRCSPLCVGMLAGVIRHLLCCHELHLLDGVDGNQQWLLGQAAAVRQQDAGTWLRSRTGCTSAWTKANNYMAALTLYTLSELVARRQPAAYLPKSTSFSVIWSQILHTAV